MTPEVRKQNIEALYEACVESVRKNDLTIWTQALDRIA